MRVILLFFLTIFISSCLSYRFVDKENNIDKLSPQINLDSVIILNPAYTIRYSSPNNDFNYLMVQNGRPDSFNKIFTKSLFKNQLLSNFYPKISTSCMDNKMVFNKWLTEDNYNFKKHSCIKFKEGYYNVFLNVSMGVKDAEMDISDREYESVNCYIIIVKNKDILYYKYFASIRQVKKSRFPKGSKDRKDYPYFANDQIERVVKNITADLIKRIVPAKK